MRILILFFVSTFFNLSAQDKFYHVFSDNGNDFGTSVVQLDDNSYTVVGRSSSFSNGPSQVFMLHLDSLGSKLWSTDFGGLESDGAEKVLYKNDVGYFVAGFSNSHGANDYDFYLFKTDDQANLEWERYYGGNGWERVHDAALTRDTGVILVGETSSNDLSDQQSFIVRTDINGDTLWTSSFGGVGEDFATAIVAITDSTFAIAGVRSVQDSIHTKGFIRCIHEDGTVLWDRIYGSNGGRYWLNDISIDNTSIVAVGGNYVDDVTEEDFFDVRVAADGSTVNEFTWVNGGRKYNVGIAILNSSKACVASFVHDDWSFPGGNDLNIDFYNPPNFNWIKSCFLSHENPDIFGEIIPTNDGGVFVVGSTSGLVSGGNDVFVSKYGSSFECSNVGADMIVDGIVGVESLKDVLQGVDVYPNPFNEKLQIEIDKPGNYTVIIRNIAGQIINEKNVNNSASMDTSSFDSGMYFVTVYNEQMSAYTVYLVK